MKTIKRNWLEPSERRWPDEAGPWVLQLERGAGPDGVECVGLRLSLAPDEPVRPLSATLLRQVRVQDEVRRARSVRAAGEKAEFLVAYDDAVAGESGNAHLLEEVGAHAAQSTRREVDDWSPSKSPGRPAQYGTDHYRAIARVYSEAHVRGEPPTKAVMTTFVMSSATASRHVSRARELGLLPEARRGQPSANVALLGVEERA